MAMVFRTFVFWTHPWFHHTLSSRWSDADELNTHLSTTAVSRLLHCCNTWWVGGSLRGCLCCTTYCCTAVVQGCGWVDRFVAAVLWCVHEFVGYFYFIFFLPLYRPRAGIVKRITSCVKLVHEGWILLIL